METLDVRVPLNRVGDIFNVAVVSIVIAADRGEVEIGSDDCIGMAECERWARDRGDPPVRLVRALSVLPRFQTVYTTGEVAKVLGVSANMVRNLMDNGTLSAYYLPNGSSDRADQPGARRMTRLALAEYLSRNPCAQADAMGIKIGTKRRKRAASMVEDKPNLLD